jgi:hypothetical protein
VLQEITLEGTDIAFKALQYVKIPRRLFLEHRNNLQDYA